MENGRFSHLCRIAHDARNKLGIIVGYADILSGKVTLDVETQQGLKHIRQAALEIDAMLKVVACPQLLPKPQAAEETEKIGTISKVF